MKRQGYSLLELLITLSLVLLLGVLVSSGVRLRDSLLVRAEADLLYTTCRYLQYAARCANSTKELVFDAKAHSYSVDGKVYQLPQQVRVSSAFQAKGPPSDPQRVITDPVTFKKHTLCFFPDGTVQAGSVYLTDCNQSCLYALTVSVGDLSIVRLYRYTNSDKQWHTIF